MDTTISRLRDQIEELHQAAFWDFYFLSDYIWKIPDFLSADFRREIRKALAYHQDEPDMLKSRLNLEKQKILNSFSYHMTIGNLLQVVSIFEVYALLLARIIEPVSGISLSEVKKKYGIWKTLEYFRLVGLVPFGYINWEQISALIRVRNCFVHASGFLNYCKDSKKIQEIIKNKRFLPKDILDRRYQKKLGTDDLSVITDGPLGPRIQIKHEYVHYASGLFHGYYDYLHERALLYLDDLKLPNHGCT